MNLFQKSSHAVTGIFASTVLLLCSTDSFAQFDTAPTYFGGVREALVRSCAECHRDDAPNLGGISAPFSVLSYEQAKVWAPVIALRLQDGTMPPWGAHKQHQGTFKRERYISDFDKALIVNWVEKGALEGDASSQSMQQEVETVATNEPSEAPDGSLWWMGVPDARVGFIEPIEVCEEASDWQPTIRMELADGDLSEHRWVKATEIRPGSSTMHHSVSNYLGVAVPGRGPQVYPDGWGFLLPADPFISINMHYA